MKKLWLFLALLLFTTALTTQAQFGRDELIQVCYSDVTIRMRVYSEPGEYVYSGRNLYFDRKGRVLTAHDADGDLVFIRMHYYVDEPSSPYVPYDTYVLEVEDVNGIALGSEFYAIRYPFNDKSYEEGGVYTPGFALSGNNRGNNTYEALVTVTQPSEEYLRVDFVFAGFFIKQDGTPAPVARGWWRVELDPDMIVPC